MHGANPVLKCTVAIKEAAVHTYTQIFLDWSGIKYLQLQYFNSLPVPEDHVDTTSLEGRKSSQWLNIFHFCN